MSSTKFSTMSPITQPRNIAQGTEDIEKKEDNDLKYEPKPTTNQRNALTVGTISSTTMNNTAYDSVNKQQQQESTISPYYTTITKTTTETTPTGESPTSKAVAAPPVPENQNQPSIKQSSLPEQPAGSEYREGKGESGAQYQSTPTTAQNTQGTETSNTASNENSVDENVYGTGYNCK